MRSFCPTFAELHRFPAAISSQTNFLRWVIVNGITVRQVCLRLLGSLNWKDSEALLVFGSQSKNRG